MNTNHIARYAAVAAAIILGGCAAQSPTNQDVACIYGKLHIGASPHPVLTHDGKPVECTLAKDRKG